MTEALPVSADRQPENVLRPFSALEILCQPEFMQACLNNEKRLTVLHASKDDPRMRTLDAYESQVNELSGIEELTYQPVIVSGKIYPMYEPDARLRPLDWVDVEGERLRYGGVVFAPIQGRGSVRYEAMFRLLPRRHPYGVQHYFAKFDAVSQLDFPEYSVADFDSGQLLAQLKDILKRSRIARTDETFQIKSQMGMMEYIEHSAKEYTEELDPYIALNVPMLVNTDRYVRRPLAQKRTLERRTQRERDPRHRRIISGRMVQIAFRSLHAINPNVPPFLELLDEVDGAFYEIPLDANIGNIIPLHAAVY